MMTCFGGYVLAQPCTFHLQRAALTPHETTGLHRLI